MPPEVILPAPTLLPVWLPAMMKPPEVRFSVSFAESANVKVWLFALEIQAMALAR